MPKSPPELDYWNKPPVPPIQPPGIPGYTDPEIPLEGEERHVVPRTTSGPYTWQFEPLPESDIHEIKSSCDYSEVHTDAKQVCGTCGVKDRRFGSRERNTNRCCRSKCANKKIPHDQNVVYQWEDTSSSAQCRSFLLCNACVHFLRERCDAALQPVLRR